MSRTERDIQVSCSQNPWSGSGVYMVNGFGFCEGRVTKDIQPRIRLFDEQDVDVIVNLS